MRYDAEPDERVPRDLLDVAHGDRGAARLLYGSLRQVAEHAGQPELREMAREVLSGRITLRQAVQSDAYREVLSGRLGEFMAWYRNLDPQERDEQVAAVRRRVAQIREAEADVR